VSERKATEDFGPMLSSLPVTHIEVACYSDRFSQHHHGGGDLDSNNRTLLSRLDQVLKYTMGLFYHSS